KLEDQYSPATRNAWNQNYNFCHIAAHGSYQGFWSQYSNPVFTTSDIPSLTNTMPTILTSIACHPGDFDEYGDCFAEQIMNKTGGSGTVACALNSRYGFGSPPSMGPSEAMDTCFFAVMLKDTFNIGIIHGATKNHYRNLIWSQGVWHYCGLELNLFGDPEMQVKLSQANEPYVYISDRVLNDDNNNGIWDPGEYAELIVTLSNGGSVDASNVQAVLRATTNSQYVDISDSTSAYGTISAGGSVNNASDPFKMTADAGTPNGTVIGFTLHVTADGGYSWDYNFTYAVGNPPVDYYDHDIGNVRYTVTNRGICGFLNDGQTQGSGFHYPISGTQYLYIGSVWAGNASNYVVNRDYSAENSGDWQQVAGVYGDGTVYSDQDSWAQYNDAGMGSPKDITCTQKGWAWSDPGGQDFVIVEYTFRNDGSSAVNGLYFGQFMDWDVGDPYNTDQGGIDASRNLIYQYGPGTKYVGIGLLEPSTASNVSFIKNEDYVYPNSYILDSDKIQFLNGSINVPSTSGQDDWSGFVGAGPFNVSAGDSAIFAVVILGGEGVSDIQQNYDSAKVRYPPVGVVEKPEIPKTPSYFNISKVYPEPFSKFVNIEFTVPQESKILLHIYDASGRLIKTLVNSKQSAGKHSVKWDGTVNRGKKAASGVYFCQLIVSGSERKVTRKLLLVK
ncbi:MAG: T9SS type A sorting domain-containing protein, partial [Candidatus Cloacimonadota bacterium]